MENLGQVGLSDEQAELLNVAASFCRNRSPIEKVRKLLEDETGFDRDIWQELADLGWLGIAIPEAFGGAGLSVGEIVPVMEQLGRNMCSSPFFSTTLAAQTLLLAGTEAQQKKWLPKLAQGTIATIGFQDLDCAGDVDEVNAVAKKYDDRFSLTGQKILVENGAVADFMIGLFKYDQKPILILLEKNDLLKAEMRREVIIDETKRSYAISLNEIDVPVSAALDIEKTDAALKQIDLIAILLSAAEMCGGAQATVEYTAEYLKTRKQFGRHIGSYQGLKHPFVNAYVDYEQARSHLYSAANCFNDQGTGEIATRMASVVAEKAFSYVTDRAIQFHGGFGFTYDCDAQLYRRRAIWHASQFGDGAFHKKKLAEMLL